MNKARNLAQSLLAEAGFPGEILTGVPVIEIKGLSEAVIMRHQGIVAYRSETVKIASTVGTLVVIGKDLEIFRMNRERIVLHGQITRVEIGAQPC